MATPVIMDDSSAQRNSAALPISCGVEKRPIGIEDRNFARISGVSSPIKLFSNGVSPATGLRAFTRMPCGASSMAMLLVAVIIHPLVALYQLRFGRGETPAVEAMFKITPDFCRFMTGTIYLADR